MKKKSPRARIRELEKVHAQLQRAHNTAINARELETASDILEVMATVWKRMQGLYAQLAR